MDSKLFLFEVLYALAARGGREAVLFGDSMPAAREAFSHSLIGPKFPEVWFELPFSGEPWFDLHALSESCEPPQAGSAPIATDATVDPALLKWYAGAQGVRQLALSWDTGSGCADEPAIQLLVKTRDPQVTCDFLQAVGQPDAVPRYRAFRERVPRGWFPCYTGVFPSRPDVGLRVECIPSDEEQRVYAADPSALERDLRQVGLENLAGTIIPRCHQLLQYPLPIEFQLNVLPNGTVGTTFSASVRFNAPPGDEAWAAYDVDGATGALMQQVEQWGLTDNRWRTLGDAIFVKRISRGDAHMTLYCYPAFLKLRWRDGEPVDAKAYLIAGVQ